MSQTTSSPSERTLIEVQELRAAVFSLQKQGAEHTNMLTRIEVSSDEIRHRLFGNGEKGLIERVDEHDKFITKTKGALLVIPLIGGFLAWLLERGVVYFGGKP